MRKFFSYNNAVGVARIGVKFIAVSSAALLMLGALGCKEPSAPHGGRYMDPQGIGHRLDSSDVEGDFRRIYYAINTFRIRHKRFPTYDELMNLPSLSKEDFQDSGWAYADTNLRAHQSEQYALTFLGGTRPDGTPIPIFPTKNDHDLLIGCPNCLRKNAIIPSNGGGFPCHYSGYYVALYTNGEIKHVPFSHLKLAPWHSDGGYLQVLPDQSGVPEGTIPITTFWTRTQKDLATWDP
jgi:hypothetical protein